MRSHKNKFIIAGIILVSLIIMRAFGILSPIENGARFLFAPLQKIIYTTGEKLKDSRKRADKENLEDENIYLKEQLENLKIENANLKIVENENKKLKEMLKFAQANKFDYLTASVIGKTEEGENALIIDKGVKDGIEEGLAVINQKGLIIGKTLKCNNENCYVLLLNSSQSRIAASILDHEEASGAVEGEYGLSMKMKLIPQHISLLPGDIIVTAGLEKNIPYGLIIGEVNKIDKNEGELFQTANIQPLFPLDSAHIISVIAAS